MIRFAVPDESCGLVVIDPDGEPLTGQIIPEWVQEKLRQAERKGLVPLSYAAVWDDSDTRDEDIVRVWNWSDLIDDDPYDFDSLWEEAPRAY